MKILPISAVNPWLKEQPKYWDVISVGPALPYTRLCRRHCELDCDDVLVASPCRPVWGGIPSREPSSEHMRQALAFARESEDERLIVHCHAGISRSPAIAWCILLERFRDIPLATEMLFEIRPEAMPNPVIIRHGLEIITGSAAVHDAVMADMQRRSSHRYKAGLLTVDPQRGTFLARCLPNWIANWHGLRMDWVKRASKHLAGRSSEVARADSLGCNREK